jgi:hypothetical protein
MQGAIVFMVVSPLHALKKGRKINLFGFSPPLSRAEHRRGGRDKARGLFEPATGG